MTIRVTRLLSAVALTLALQACASPQTDTRGLTALDERDFGALASQRLMFRSTAEPLSYQLQPGGALQVNNGGSVHVGGWSQRGNRLCVSVPLGASPDCFEVFRTANNGFRFRDQGGTVSEEFELRG